MREKSQETNHKKQITKKKRKRKQKKGKKNKKLPGLFLIFVFF